MVSKRSTAESHRFFYMEKFKEIPKESNPIPNFNGYFVTIDGDIYSNKTQGHYKVATHYKKRKTFISNCGYPIVTFWNGKKRIMKSVHRIVWESFNGEIPSHLTINHKDGVKTNNHLSNLELMTPSQNTQHGVDMGLIPSRGSDNGNSKLTEQYVCEIRVLWELRLFKQPELAEIYGVDSSNISCIVLRKTWKHV